MRTGGGRAAGLGLAALVLLFPREAHLSGPTSLEHRTAHLRLGQVAGPSIHFADSESESRYHQAQREQLRPELERLGAALEAALAHPPLAALLAAPDAGDGPEIRWAELVPEAELLPLRHALSPYAQHLLQQQARAAAGEHERRWDRRKVPLPFTLALAYPGDLGNLQLGVRLGAKPRWSQLVALEQATRAALRPIQRSLRLELGGERTPPCLPSKPAGCAALEREEAGTFSVQTNQVLVKLTAGGEPHRDLARKVAHRIAAELATVPDDQPGEFDRTFRFALRRGGYRVAQTPVGGGFTSPWLAEVPPEVELGVTLRTVESDEGGALDAALTQRMFEVARKDLPGLKRRDAPGALSEIGPADWVLVQLR